MALLTRNDPWDPTVLSGRACVTPALPPACFTSPTTTWHLVGMPNGARMQSSVKCETCPMRTDLMCTPPIHSLSLLRRRCLNQVCRKCGALACKMCGAVWAVMQYALCIFVVRRRQGWTTSVCAIHCISRSFSMPHYSYIYTMPYTLVPTSFSCRTTALDC